MRLTRRITLACVVIFFFTILPQFQAVLYAQTNDLPTVAVLNLDVQVGVPAEYTVPMSDMIRTALFQTGRVRVLERNKMDDILSEQGFQLSDCTSDECAVQVGQLLGVQQMIAGSLSKLGETFTITLRLIDVETGELLAAEMTSCRCTIDEVISNSVFDVSRKVVGLDGGTVRRTLGSLTRQPEALSGGPLPGMEFVHIPGGTFLMGSPSNEAGRGREEGPQHRVTVSSFEMLTTEVTQAMWRKLMGSTIRQQRDLADPGYSMRGEGDDYPIYYVSWEEAQEFVAAVNRRDPGKGYRLPTEAEWEYACRAGTTTRFYTGASESDLARAGWYKGNSNNTTHPVGQKTPNAWGLYDMHGNVWEWCNDWHGGYSSDSVTDPAGPGSGSDRVERGGGWGTFAGYCWSTCRSSGNPTSRGDYIGFRLVRSNLR